MFSARLTQHPILLNVPADENRLPSYIFVEGATMRQLEIFTVVVAWLDRHKIEATPFVKFLDPNKPLSNWRNFTKKDLSSLSLDYKDGFKLLLEDMGEKLLDDLFLSHQSHSPHTFRILSDSDVMERAHIAHHYLYLEPHY